MTTTTDVYAALLRPAVVQILRSTGYSFAKPGVIDSLTDLTARYILLLASSTAKNAFNCHRDYIPTVQDVRHAFFEVGALRPQMTPSEEASKGLQEVDGEFVPFEDLRGVKAFVAWAQGPVNRDIRRIAGFGDEIDVNEIAAGVDETEDYLTAMKKKHSKTAEESRYQGTTLGKDLDLAPISIAGADLPTISEWMIRQSKSGARAYTDDVDMEGVSSTGRDANTPATSVLSSAPPSPHDAESTSVLQETISAA